MHARSLTGTQAAEGCGNDPVNVAIAPPRRAEVAKRRKAPRAGLADLEPHLHASVIGMCLTDDALRDILQEALHGEDWHDASGFELHQAALELAAENSAGTRALQDVLDSRYETMLERFDAATSDGELYRLWRASCERGETPGAYWAVLTHPCASVALRENVFGEVHGMTRIASA